ncbi:kinase-like domain-containing protein [Hyaloraphidium curvatum]|nr:kinase-like domain-containing protein [Hyaloraphidium curvatum]
MASARAPRRPRGDYEPLSLLGAGSHATVRLARHRATGALVALKTVRKPPPGAERDAARARWAVEAAALEAAAGHPGFPKLLDSFETESRFTLVLEYIEGPNLQTYSEECGPLPEHTVVAIVSSLLYSLAHLHARGIAHRDIKPANVVLRDRHDPSSAVLVDFGCASTRTAGLRTLVGTPLYFSPELVRGEPASEKCDLWGVGCVAYELLCGRSPFHDAASMFDLYDRIAGARISSPAGRMSPAAERFVRSLLRADPAARPTAGEALADPWISPPSPVAAPGEPWGAEGGQRVDFVAATGTLVVGEMVEMPVWPAA